MGTERVKNFFKQNKLDLKIKEFDMSTATVELAAEAVGVKPAKIAKTMAFQLKDRPILIVAKGTARVNNRKFKDSFNQKAKMMSPKQVLETTGYPVGGVCPFDLPEIEIYLDNSLKEFDYIFPAAGTPNSAVKISTKLLEEITNGTWVDVCA